MSLVASKHDLNIQLSEPAFAEAKRVAAAIDLSVEEMIAADVEAMRNVEFYQ